MAADDLKHLLNQLTQGRAYVDEDNIQFQPVVQTNLVNKCQQAYRWISDHALHTPYQDIDCGDPKILRGNGHKISLSTNTSYASFILLPLLTLFTSRRLLLIGAPGRGKTTIATLMGYLAGYSLPDMRHTIQHGHPQMTQNDLLGSPLPSDLVNAKSQEDIEVLWRSWISMRVKVIDEYNRIPTKTQSSLLSLLAEGYAEMYEKTIHSPESAWFLTANDDLGGGTFPVIEALKDRIDIAVRCTQLDPQHINALAERLEQPKTADDFLPQDIVFTEEELAQISNDILAIPIPDELLNFLSHFISQLDFCQQASTQLEFQNKDTIHLSGKRLGHVCTDDCPLDKYENICSQAESGVSTRAYTAILHYSKALAFFREEDQVSLSDFRQIIPWVLHEKLTPNPQSMFFHKTEHQVYLTDRIAWITQLFDLAYSQYMAYEKIRRPVDRIQQIYEQSTANLTDNVIEKRCTEIQKLMEKILSKQELNSPVHADLILLKKLHANYQQKRHS